MTNSEIKQEILIEKILAHDINLPFTDEILKGLSHTPGELPLFDDDWTKGTLEDTSVIHLRRECSQLSDYLCCQVHLLNLLCLNYGIKNEKPFIQLNIGSVLEKIIGNPISKHNDTPFSGDILKGFNYDHIELFPFSSTYARNSMYKSREFHTLKEQKIEDAQARIEKTQDPVQKLVATVIESNNVARDSTYEIEQIVREKDPGARGKITGPWLISETNTNGEKVYLCITPHGNKTTYPDPIIKSIIERAKIFRL